MLPPPDAVAPHCRDVCEWLRRNNATSLAELYEGAVDILSRGVRGRLRFVAHAVREIRNRLPGVLAPEQVRERLDYRKRCGTIRKEWRRGDNLAANSGANGPSASGFVAVPLIAAEEIDRLLEDDRAVQDRVHDAARRLYVAVVRVRSGRTLIPSEIVTIEPSIREWHKVTQWFVDRAHDNGTPESDLDMRELNDRISAFDHVFFSLIQEFYPATKVLDDILEDANS
jgi:hypothetical protein